MTSHLAEIDALISRGDTAGARVAANAALDHAPDHFLYYERLARISLMDRRRAEARDYYERALKLEPSAQWIRLALERLADLAGPEQASADPGRASDAGAAAGADRSRPDAVQPAAAEAAGAPRADLAAHLDAVEAEAEARIALLTWQLDQAREEIRLATIGRREAVAGRARAIKERDEARRALDAALKERDTARTTPGAADASASTC